MIGKRILVIDDINNKEEVITRLGKVETDEDFNGNNGKDFTWEDAIESGCSSTQEYVINVLSHKDLKGLDLIREFFSWWFDNDGYYQDWEIDSFEQDNKTIVSVVYNYGV